MLAPKILNDYIIEKSQDSSRDIEIDANVIANSLKTYAICAVNDPETFWLASNKNEDIIGGFASKYNSQKSFKKLSLYYQILTNSIKRKIRKRL